MYNTNDDVLTSGIDKQKSNTINKGAKDVLRSLEELMTEDKGILGKILTNPNLSITISGISMIVLSYILGVHISNIMNSPVFESIISFLVAGGDIAAGTMAFGSYRELKRRNEYGNNVDEVMTYLAKNTEILQEIKLTLDPNDRKYQLIMTNLGIVTSEKSIDNENSTEIDKEEFLEVYSNEAIEKDAEFTANELLDNAASENENKLVLDNETEEKVNKIEIINDLENN